MPTSHLAAVIAHCRIPTSAKQHLLQEVHRTPRTMLTCEHFVAIFATLDRIASAQSVPEVRHFRSRVAVVLQRAIMHRYFSIVGCCVVGLNVLIITIELAREYERVRSNSNTYLGLKLLHHFTNSKLYSEPTCTCTCINRNFP